MIIASASYVRYFQNILLYFAKTLDIPVILIDDASLLPPWIASDHVEYGAYTLRKKYWNMTTMLQTEKSIKPIQTACTRTHDELKNIRASHWYKKYASQLSEISQ